jgi:hypothetical protein
MSHNRGRVVPEKRNGTHSVVLSIIIFQWRIRTYSPNCSHRGISQLIESLYIDLGVLVTVRTIQTLSSIEDTIGAASLNEWFSIFAECCDTVNIRLLILLRVLSLVRCNTFAIPLGNVVLYNDFVASSTAWYLWAPRYCSILQAIIDTQWNLGSTCQPLRSQ